MQNKDYRSFRECPFCGSNKVKVEGKTKKALSYEGLEHRTYAVRCNKCHARGGTSSGYIRNALYSLTERGKELMERECEIRNRATEAWNRRAENGKS
jgi:ssDNA-binding Zn-finger/Zn-ribbon topoisomerase 1